MSVQSDNFGWIFDQQFRKDNLIIAGSDEAGRGAWAGPLVVASVILPSSFSSSLIKDSKKMTIQQREKQFKVIKKVAIAYSIVVIDTRMVEKLNPKQASIYGMQSTLLDLKVQPTLALIDGEQLPHDFSIKTQKIIKGDNLSLSIAAASILAKVTRDHIMYQYHSQYPDYNFLHNVGYGTKAHLQGLMTNGVTNLHRRTYKPIKDLLAIKTK
ncbi:Ribonuclease HII [Mesoplasma sp. JKS002658]|uniref:ribonuclease HII n=1 Tax=Mesoplasma whartonense TaxID=2878854 RepID=UPI002022A6AD|nr:MULTISPECIES: ribonuclease HII [unclassified Mesoplasma]MCL8211104.1 Ribonuclease HII [Mesoplasma sp. JKS002664]MCL8211765.1 Ribonuclease HII [Mesoplasma sp. JKS002662]MCL8213253.1 Ribonuclease HII [Mesoplasma sp. JKS002660]MCL8214130.1 Ribonuclease HII [Mesoplasma sp. JKS002658]MCL8214442.1 Ribonuclease HII [Mesoplasma sp. JKS002663]